MPHYADGTPATPGDLVRGKGYNIRDEHGELAEITGTLLHVDPNSSACNVQVGVLEFHEIPEGASTSVVGHLAQAGAVLLPGRRYAKVRVEYGQADHFVKV